MARKGSPSVPDFWWQGIMPSLSSASVGLAAAAVLASLSLLFKRKGAHNRSVWALALLPIATLAILERRRLLATLWGGKPGKRGESEGTLEIKAETAPAAEQDAVTEKPVLRFVAMSDTHCRHRDHVSLPPGDVLLHCGDFTMKGGLAEVSDFADWLTSLTQYKHKVIIAGNHELTLDVPFYKKHWKSWHKGNKQDTAAVKAALLAVPGLIYLEHSGVTIRGVRIFGSPHQPPIHPKSRMAFNPREEGDRDALYDSIPGGSVDVLLTHGPPYSKRDVIPSGKHVGCFALGRAVARVKPLFHVFGHVHEGAGSDVDPLSVYSRAIPESEPVLTGTHESGGLSPPPCRPLMAAPTLPSRLLTAFEPLAVSVRSGFDESLHSGTVVALNSDGSIAFALGDPTVPVYPRSALKPLQAVGMLECGLDLPPHLLALACSSHNGSPMHVQGVTDILATAGLTPADLQNTKDFPLDPESSVAYIRSGGVKSSITMNCSGKHAAMLVTCVKNGWPTETYRSPEHPLQVALTATVSRLSGDVIAHIGCDGCGAPAHAISLLGLARAYSKIAAAGGSSVADDGVATMSPECRVASAMSGRPDMVGGEPRDVTKIMRGLPGAIAKDGAEAILACALPDGRAVAIKVGDGSNRARLPAMEAALTLLGVDLSAVEPNTFTSNVLGHGEPVGKLTVIGKLAAAVANAKYTA